MRMPWFRWTLAFQLAVFVGWIGLEERKRIPAATVLLETAPVDPRDLWAGQYLTLAYRISAIERLPGFPTPAPKIGSPIAVYLKPATNARKAKRLIWIAAGCRPGGIPGKHSSPPDVWRPGLTPGVWVTGVWRGGRVGVDYGIGRYYFSESRMEEVRHLTSGGFFVECAVSKDGRLTISRIVE